MRRQVCRRARKRYEALGLDCLEAYARRLEQDATEWPHLDACCRVTISRFYRDRRLWQVLGREILPRLYPRAADRDPPRLRIWSAGCGAGEEPYTATLLLRLGGNPLPEGLEAEIVATDLDAHQLERAGRAHYPESSLRDLPAEWRRKAFVRSTSGDYRLEGRYLEGVRFVEQDIRREAPAGMFDLIFCRYLAFTYFADAGQAACLTRLLTRLEPHGWLAIGSHERLPLGSDVILRVRGKLPLHTPVDGPRGRL